VVEKASFHDSNLSVRKLPSSTVCGNSSKTVGKAFQVKLVENMSRVCKAVNAIDGYFEESTLFWLLHDSICVI
jgi:hypothetical protein